MSCKPGLAKTKILRLVKAVLALTKEEKKGHKEAELLCVPYPYLVLEGKVIKQQLT